MNKYTKVISGFVGVTLFMAGFSVSADDFNKRLKTKSSHQYTNSLSGNTLYEKDSWSMQQRVKRSLYKENTGRSVHEKSIAVMDKSELSLWRKNLGNPVKL